MTTRPAHDLYVCGTPFEPDLKAGSMTALDLAPVAARLGAQGVEFRTVYWTDRIGQLGEARKQVRDLGLGCTYASFSTLYADSPDARDDLLRDIEDAAALGSPLLRIFRGGVRPDDADDATRKAAETALEAADAAGIKLALENFVKAPGNLLPEILEVLDDIDSPALGVNLDTGNYVKNGQDPVAAARALAPRTIYCHFKDVRSVDGGPVVTFPGNGTVDLNSVLAELLATPAPVPLGFEYPAESDPLSAISSGIAFVRRWESQRA